MRHLQTERAWVKYYEESGDTSSKEIYYYGFINLQGNVIFSIPADGIEVYNIGKGSAIITSENGLVLINKNGETKMKLDGEAEIKAYGGGFAYIYIYQNKSTITSIEHLYGVVDHAGKWIEPLQDLQSEEAYDYDCIEYIGDGFFGEKNREYYSSYSVWNGDKSVKITFDGVYRNCSISFSNGMAFVSHSIRDSWSYDTVSITVITNEGKHNESKKYIK